MANPGSSKTPALQVLASSLPWDGGQFRRSDGYVLGGALLFSILLAVVTPPPVPMPKLAERVIVPVNIIPAPVQPAPVVSPPKPEPEPAPARPTVA